MGGSLGVQRSKSELQTRQLPGIFGEGARGRQAEKFASSRRLGTQLEDILGGIQPQGQVRGAFEEALLRPQFGPQTASEEALLKSITDLTGGAAAVRGLGAPTPGALAQNIAPALIGLRQQQLSGLAGGVGLDIQRRQQAIQGLLELIGQAAPQTVAGQKQQQRGFQFGVSAAPSPGGG